MLIDWFTVVAQAVNFLILVLLLRWLLWDRIVDAVDRRRARIRSEYDEAEQRRQEADDAAERQRQAEKEIREKRDEMLREAREEAEDQRRKGLERAREEIEEQKQSWQKGLRDQQEDFVEQLRRDLGHSTLEMARALLRRVADQDLEHRMVERFRTEATDLSDEDRGRLVGDTDEEPPELEVLSHWELDADDRAAVEEALRRAVGDETTVRFRTEETMVCGLRVKGRDHVLDFSLDRELERVGRRMEKRLREPTEEPTADDEEHAEEEANA